jgi:D-3-phosphoglycerate dehydrogenase
MKILVSDDVSQHALDLLRTQDSLQVVYLPAEKGRTVAEEIADAEALIVRSATKVTAALLERAAKLRVIGRAGVGVDNVDLEAATNRGVVVMNTPGGNAASVAEHTLALMLALARRLPQADAALKQGRWEKKKFVGVELRGKVLGLIGLGKIGTEVARLAQAFEMEILGYDPYVSSVIARELNVRLVPLEELLKSSDFLSVHAAATPETRHLLNAETLKLAKPGVRIVNCARGELINEADLLAALESGRVAGAGLDVFETEPPTDLRLAQHPNVIATPHIAGSTEEAQEIVGIRIAEQVRDYLLHGIVRNAVNMPSLSPEEFKKLQPYLELGERLGSFLAQIAGGRLEQIRISYDGGLAQMNTHLVKNAVLKGILARVLSEPVNLINAGMMAQGRGIEVLELSSVRRAAYSNSLGIALKTENASASALGMVGLRGALRVLGIDDIDIEAPLRGVILFIRNQDVPGVIGRVGTILGERRINIANFALGRDQKSGMALGLVNVDNHIPDEVLKEIGSIPAVREARVIEL